MEGAAYPMVIRSRAWDRKDLGTKSASLNDTHTQWPDFITQTHLIFFYNLPAISSKCDLIKGLVHWLDQGPCPMIRDPFISQDHHQLGNKPANLILGGTRHIHTTTALIHACEKSAVSSLLPATFQQLSAPHVLITEQANSSSITYLLLSEFLGHRVL